MRSGNDVHAAEIEKFKSVIERDNFWQAESIADSSKIQLSIAILMLYLN